MYFISQFKSWQQNLQASFHICVDAKYVNGLYNFLRNTSIIKTFVPSKHCFWLKYKSCIHNIVFSRERVVLSESGGKYA